jgi:hypothetical protein
MYVRGYLQGKREWPSSYNWQTGVSGEQSRHFATVNDDEFYTIIDF